MSYLSDVLRLNSGSPSRKVGSLTGAGTMAAGATATTGPLAMIVAGTANSGGNITIDGVTVANAGATLLQVPAAVYAICGVGQSIGVAVTGAGSAILSVQKVG